MLRLSLLLGTALLGLAVLQAGARPAPPREANPAADFAASPDVDLVGLLQAVKKHYTVSKRISDLKGKTGKHHIGTTTNGRHLDAHVKNGKVHKMEMRGKGLKKTVSHTKVVKAKTKPAA